MRCCLLFLVASPLLAQSGLNGPLAGLAQGADHRVQKIWGIGGNLITEPLDPPEVLNVAFGKGGGLLKTESELVLLDRNGERADAWSVPAGPAVLGFDDDDRPAVAWLPGDGSWWRVREYGPEKFEWKPPGEVLAVTLRHGQAIAVVRRDDGVWITGEGQAPEMLGNAEVRAALFLPDGRLLLSFGPYLLLKNSSGLENRIDMPAEVATLSRMGGEWIVAGNSSDRYAVRVRGDQAQYFPLPGAEGQP